MKNALAFLPAFLVAAAALIVPAAQAATLAGDAATDLDTMTIVDGLGSPTDIAILDGGARLVVTQKGGDVAIVRPGMGQVDDHINVAPLHNEQGLLGVVADPNFAENHYLYFFADVGDAQNKHQIIRYVLGDDDSLTESMVIVGDGLYGPANHNGGGIIIDEGYIYFSVGDTGENATPPVNQLGTCLNKPNGKILRVALDGSIPTDNPLTDDDMVTGCNDFNDPISLMAPDERVFAWGFRNPFRFWVDPQTKKLWVGDVGEGAREEVAVGDGGMHFGWPFFEGTVEYNQGFKPANDCMGVTPATECVPAAYEYDHSAGRNAIMGGQILDVCGWSDAWKGRYIFADHGSGEVWTLDVNATRDGVVQNSLADFGDFGDPAAFRVGPDQALYVVEEGGGSVQRVTPKQLTGEVCDAPPGGSGGTGGTGGAGGAAGSAGSAGSPIGGAPPVGGNGGTNTAGTNTGGASAGSAGTGVGTAGTNGVTPAPVSSSDDGGCGCRVTRSTSVPSGVLLFAGALGLLWGRRRRSRRA